MRIFNGEVGLEVDDTGDATGYPALLLHGWPDSSRLWRHQRAALAGAGFRTVSLDLRGFGASDRPASVDEYNLANHFADILAVLDALELERVHLVGHDWGGVVSWVVAAFAPDRVDHFVPMCMGHPTAMKAAGRDQLERFWYALLFQFPDAAERWLTADGWRNLREFLAHPDHEDVVAGFDRDGGLRESMHIYRANLNADILTGIAPEVPPVTAPTLAIRGRHDPTIGEAWVKASQAYTTASWQYEELDAGHWVQLEQPEAVNRLLLGFLPLDGRRTMTADVAHRASTDAGR